MMNQHIGYIQQDVDLDAIIKTLLQQSTSKNIKNPLTQQKITALIHLSKQEFLKESMLKQIQAPVKICGDIHGQFSDMLRLFQYGGYPPNSSYLFLGDYVDRGRQGIQTICLLMAFKIKYPHKMTILRGNHETASITRIYGFYQQCKNRYSVKLWKKFIDCFNCMPVCALIDERILCMHGGLSPDLVTLEQINQIIRPTDIPDTGILCDLLWADPDSQVKMWGQSQRGVSYIFGSDIIQMFLHKNDLDLVCRAHQVVQDGYQFFAKKKLVTVFSAPNYCGQFNNCGAMMRVDENLSCSFQVLKPNEKVGAFRNARPRTPLRS